MSCNLVFLPVYAQNYENVYAFLNSHVFPLGPAFSEFLSLSDYLCLLMRRFDIDFLIQGPKAERWGFFQFWGSKISSKRKLPVILAGSNRLRWVRSSYPKFRTWFHIFMSWHIHNWLSRGNLVVCINVPFLCSFYVEHCPCLLSSSTLLSSVTARMASLTILFAYGHHMNQDFNASVGFYFGLIGFRKFYLGIFVSVIALLSQ